MPILAIEGIGKVELGDEFTRLSPEQQDATVREIARSKKSNPSMTQGTAALEGFLSGASANFRDEIYGASKASGLPDILGGFRAPVGAARLAYESFTGQPGEASKTYEEAVAEKRGQQKQAQEQFPGTYLAGNIGGALAMPAGIAVRGATLPVRMAQGAGVGAAYGALSGAGEGTNLPERGIGAASGGLIGGALGGISVPVVEAGARGLGAVLAKPIETIRAGLNPAGAAERAIGRAAVEAQRADPGAINRLAPHELTGGGPEMVLDTLGQPGRNLARSARNISGEAADTLGIALNPRVNDQVPRVSGWMQATFHYPDAAAQARAIRQTAETVNTPAYARAMQDGAHGVWSQELQRIAGAPAIQQAARDAMPSLANRGISEGFAAPRQMPLQFDRQTGLASPSVLPNGNQRIPDLRFWDQVKRGLDREIGKYEAQGQSGASKVDELTRLRTRLVDELDGLVPSYQTARAGAAHFFDAGDALQAGQNFVGRNFDNAETRRVLAGMNANERQLFQDGFVSRYVEMLRNLPDRADVTRAIYNSPNAREKIVIALGPQRARELEAMLRVENIMQQGLHAVQGNSTTAAQIIGAGLAGAGGGGLLGYDPSVSGLASALALAGKKGIDNRVATHIARMLTSHDPAVLANGARAVARNGNLMEILRTIDNGAARVSAQQGVARIPAGQSMGIGRANEEQPSVPGPIGQ